MTFSHRGAIALVLLLCSLAGCSTAPSVSRDVVEPAPFAATSPAPALHVTSVDVIVPSHLSVSEANVMNPAADIVWRGEPLGDRYLQVETLLEAALGDALRPAPAGSRLVHLALTVERFHALTDRARYTIGGTHDLVFVATVRDIETGEVLRAPERVDLSFAALGGQAAIDAEARGLTQAHRISTQVQSWAMAAF